MKNNEKSFVFSEIITGKKSNKLKKNKSIIMQLIIPSDLIRFRYSITL